MSDLLTLDWEGKTYELELESVTAREFKSIKTHTGIKAGQFVRAFMDMDALDADVVVALLWLFRTRAGERAEFDDDVPVFKVLEALSRNVAGDEADDPKAESGGTPKQRSKRTG